MNIGDPEPDPLRSLLEEHWSPEAVDDDEFSRGLERKRRNRARQRIAMGAATLAVAAIVLIGFVVKTSTPSPSMDASAWLAHTSAGTSALLPLPADFVALDVLFLHQVEE